MKQQNLMEAWVKSGKLQESNSKIGQLSSNEAVATASDHTDATPLETLPGFDCHAGKNWIYPTNYPVRSYQFSIVEKSLFSNTMVSLPTGLGKTFIAAVVMYNFYRWYPQGKIIFMAPTRPLVAQQIEACFSIMGIPMHDTAELTGTMAPTERTKAWKEHRVFFLTPQVMMNDLTRGVCPSELVKCLVVDEAHKATGNHSYCQVVRELVRHQTQFRILALSATPGTDFQGMETVLSNLKIGHIEMRTESSPDILPYVHGRSVEKIVIKLGKEVENIKQRFIKVMECFSKNIMKHKLVFAKDVGSMTKFMLLRSRDAFRQNPPHDLPRSQFGIVEGEFATCMTLSHALELLTLHGMRPFYMFLKGYLDDDKSSGRTKAELQRNAEFCQLMPELQAKFSFNDLRLSQVTNDQEFVIGHPKLEKLRVVVLEHFNKKKAENEPTRVMIFAQYRDSVQEITSMLQRHRPLVRAMSFLGQSSASKRSKGFTQKEQLEVVRSFRDGGYNTLISTCVGEEGLDIGEVDLIICYDSGKSPTRLIQRMGRTGRKREGRIVILVTEGKEEQAYNQSLYKQKSMTGILNSDKLMAKLCKDSPRMVPRGLNPVCHKMHMTVGTYISAKAKKSLVDSENPNYLIGMLRKQGSTSKTNSASMYLSDIEMAEWGQKFQVPKPAKTLQHASMISLTGEEPNNKKQNWFDLSEYILWQTEQQRVGVVEHSSVTKSMSSLVQMIQIMKENGDAFDYEREMNMYFKPADVCRDTDLPSALPVKAEPANNSESPDLQPPRLKRDRPVPTLRDVKSFAQYQPPTIESNFDVAPVTEIDSEIYAAFGRLAFVLKSNLMSPSDIEPIELPTQLIPIPDEFDPLAVDWDRILCKARLSSRSPLSSHKAIAKADPSLGIHSLHTVGKSKNFDVASFDEVPALRDSDSYVFTRAKEKTCDANARLAVVSEPRHAEEEWRNRLSPPHPQASNSYVFTRPKTPIQKTPGSKSLLVPPEPITPERNTATLKTSTPHSNRPNFDDAGFDLEFDDSIFADLDLSVPESKAAAPTKEVLSKVVREKDQSLYTVTQLVEMINTTQSKTQVDKSVHEDCPDFDIGDLFVDQLMSISDDEILEVSMSLDKSSNFKAVRFHEADDEKDDITILDSSEQYVRTVSNCPKTAQGKLVEAHSVASVTVSRVECQNLSDEVNDHGRSEPKSLLEKSRLVHELDLSANDSLSRFSKKMNRRPDYFQSQAVNGKSCPESCRNSDILQPPTSALGGSLYQHSGNATREPGLVGSPLPLEETSELKEVKDTSLLDDSLPRFIRKTSRQPAFLQTQVNEHKTTPATQDTQSAWRSEESNFVSQAVDGNGSGSISDEEPTQVKLRDAKRRKRKGAGKFLDNEAEESGEGSGDGSEEIHLESSYDSSFVNDDEETSGVDIGALYLQQTKSPVAAQRVKFAELRGRASEFCSQAATQRESMYVTDSFCVGSDEDIEESSEADESLEDTLLDRKRAIDKSETPVRGKKRRRIVLADSTPEKDTPPAKLPASDKDSVLDDVINNKSVQALTSPVLNRSSNLLEARRRRLKRQKELQEAFKKKIAVESKKLTLNTSPCDAMGEKTVEKSIAGDIRPISDKNASWNLESGDTIESSRGIEKVRLDQPGTSYVADKAKLESELKSVARFQPILATSGSSGNDPVIVISSRLSSGAPGLVSNLRFDHRCVVKVMAVDSCDIIISKRVGLLRVAYSDFASGSNKVKLIDDVRCLSSEFERPTLIVELDRVKDPKSEPSMKPPTKYSAMVNAALGQANVRVFHSSSQGETAAIINSVARAESRKGFYVPEFQLSAKAETMVKFLQCVPELSLVGAVCLVIQLKSLKAVIASSEQVIMDITSVSFERAKKIRAFFQRSLDV